MRSITILGAVLALLGVGHVWGDDEGRYIPIDEALLNALPSSKDGDFLYNNVTLVEEMDILVSAEEWASRFAEGGRQKRKAIRDKLWPNGVIPYLGLTSSIYRGEYEQTIRQAMAVWADLTCITFKPYDEGTDPGAVQFWPHGGCMSPVGFRQENFGLRSPKIQPFVLGSGCGMLGTIIHEFGHTIGLRHEQCRPDRDDYVTIDLDNVDGGHKHNFKKYSNQEVDTYGVRYAFQSIMHYNRYAFATNYNSPTIKPHERYMKYYYDMGQKDAPSLEDVHVVNLMYGCLSHCPIQTCPAGGVLSKDCECMCRLNPKRDKATWFPCNSGRTEETDECKDDGYDCGRLALEGKCDSDKEKMLNNCRLTCGYCGVALPTQPPTPKPTRRPRTCEDRMDTCDRWKRDCKGRYEDWLRSKCKKTCGHCNQSFRISRPACRDISAKCADYAAKNECETNPYFMNEYCQRTCHACRGSFRSATSGKCEDTNDNCQVWADRGMCDQNPEYMKVSCRKTCNICS